MGMPEETLIDGTRRIAGTMPIRYTTAPTYAGSRSQTGSGTGSTDQGPPSKPPTEGQPTPATPSPNQISLQDLYATGYDVATPTASAQRTQMPTMPEIQQASAGQAGTTSAQAKLAGPAQTYEAVQGEVTPEQLASERLAEITAQDSPLMAFARRVGERTAARRGLQNSSIAAGASTAEMVQRASPLALQEAATYSQQALTNQAAEMRSREFSAQQQNQVEMLNAQLGTDVSKFNAQQLNQASMLNAQMQTAVSQGNAQAYNAAAMEFARLETQVAMADADRDLRSSLAGAEMTNQRNLAIMQQNSELNRQFLTGTQQRDLAQMQAQYQTLLQSNQNAANLYQQHFNNIGQLMADPNMTPSRVATSIQTQQRMLEGALSMMDGIANTASRRISTGVAPSIIGGATQSVATPTTPVTTPTIIKDPPRTMPIKPSAAPAPNTATTRPAPVAQPRPQPQVRSTPTPRGRSAPPVARGGGKFLGEFRRGSF